MLAVLYLVIASILCVASYASECVPRDYGQGGTVCVCNSTYCDKLPTLGKTYHGQYQLITSNEDGLRFKKSKGISSKIRIPNKNSIIVDHSRKHQNVEGFGGAFTDAAGINIKTLPQEAQDKLLEAYFSHSGAEYSLCRVPIAGSDFSIRGYSYADSAPGTLDSFSLQEEDYQYKIPLIKKANILSDGKLKLLSTPWSSTKWMKANDDWPPAFLYKTYYGLWAEYFKKFFEEYRKNGIEYWAVTPQNQPNTYTYINDSVSWTPPELITFVAENLGPIIRNSDFGHLKIVILDDMTIIADQAQEYFANNAALSYIDGVAFHWYADVYGEANVSFYAEARTNKKHVFMLYTEASYERMNSSAPVVQLGNWERGSGYAQSIIRVLNADGIGWIDWNLALDPNGGPNYISNYVDAAVIVNASSGELYKQPMYYALAHFSKYIPRGSIRIDSTISPSLMLAGVNVTALERPDSRTILVILNPSNGPLKIQVIDKTVGYINIPITPLSINTVVY